MVSLELITIHELLRDPAYRKYFLSIPVLPTHYKGENKPWRLFILKKGETTWRTRRLSTYNEAFHGLKRLLPIIDNAAINCPALGFMPPVRTVRIKGRIDPKTKKPMLRTVVWKPQIESDMEDHSWCPHCRRPTIFRVSRLNVNRPGSKYKLPLGEALERCIICGVSEHIVDLRNPTNAQQWDTNRPKVYTLA
jgi:hypothetical protein